MKFSTIILAVLFITGCKSNQYEFNFGKNIKKELLRIEVITPFEVLEKSSDQPQIVYTQGKLIPHTTYYGQNDWKIFYDGKKVFHGGQFVSNRNNVASYDFTISNDNDSIIVEMKIDGVLVPN